MAGLPRLRVRMRPALVGTVFGGTVFGGTVFGGAVFGGAAGLSLGARISLSRTGLAGAVVQAGVRSGARTGVRTGLPVLAGTGRRGTPALAGL